jgi:hypothetical protein
MAIIKNTNRGEGGNGGQGGKMTQTMYAHVNKWKTNKQKKRVQTTNVSEDVGEKEPSYTVGDNAN